MHIIWILTHHVQWICAVGGRRCRAKLPGDSSLRFWFRRLFYSPDRESPRLPKCGCSLACQRRFITLPLLHQFFYQGFSDLIGLWNLFLWVKVTINANLILGSYVAALNNLKGAILFTFYRRRNLCFTYETSSF